MNRITEITLASSLVLHSSAVTTIGSEHEDTPGPRLHRVRAAVLLENGNVIVANAGSQSLLQYDSGGRLIREMGRPGDGQGEFRRLRTVGRIAGGRIVAWDLPLFRVTMFDTAGHLLGNFNLSAASVLGENRLESFLKRPEEVYVVGRTFLIGASSGESLSRPTGFHRETRVVSVFDLSGKRIATIGTVQADEMFRKGRSGMLAPYSYRFLAAGSTEMFFVGDGRGPLLVGYSIDDRGTQTFQLPIDRHPMNREDRELALDRFLTMLAPDIRAEYKPIFLESAVVDSFPSITDLKSGQDGLLWAQLYDLPTEPRRWMVWDPDGSIARLITLPPLAKVFDSMGDRVLILDRDGLDREILRVHRFGEPTRKP